MSVASGLGLLAVVVRYKTPLEESETLRSLAEAIETNPNLLESMGVLVWDNSPIPLVDPKLSFPFQYRFSDRNLGVSGAYNEALAYAEANGYQWLLLLDQDTSLSAEFVLRMLEHATAVEEDSVIATVVPFVRSHGTLVSPRKFGRWIRNDQIPPNVSGIYPEDAYAVNSGTVMRVAALREVGGYSEDFWLDLSDAYIFQALYRAGKRMYIAGDLELAHSVASMDFDRHMTPERYRSFLAAENLYLAIYRSRVVNAVQTIWLLARAGRQFRRYRNKAFAKITLRFLWQRLTWSESARESQWRDILKRRRSIPVVTEGTIIA